MNSLIRNWEVLAAGEEPDSRSGLFGIDMDPWDAKIVVIEVPWEGTVSYGTGTSLGPRALLSASHQLDLCQVQRDVDPWESGIGLLPADHELQGWCDESVELRDSGDAEGRIKRVNELSQLVNAKVLQLSRKILANGSVPVVLGGEHSCPYGLVAALGEQHDSFGIVHLDAHLDMRQAYGGFQHSHASIMKNLLDLPSSPVAKILHLGIRDYSREELVFQRSLGKRSECLFDADLARKRLQGASFAEVVAGLIEALPEKVYISFDIDGLSPELCPQTGTPVPGGLSFQEVRFLIELLESKTVIGFDLCEIGNSEFDANVAARVLYLLCGLV